MGMTENILAMLRLSEGYAIDRETHSWVVALAADHTKWPDAHRVFDLVRTRTLAAIEARDRSLERQYTFEEICLMCLYNETFPFDPFNPDSPHWIIKCAIDRARGIGISVQEIIDLVAPDNDCTKD